MSMEAFRRVKVKFKQQKPKEWTPASVEEEEQQQAQEQFTAPPIYSPSMSNPAGSSLMIKQRSPLKRKRKLVPKMPSNLKSKAEQVLSDDHGKSGSCKKKRTRVEDLYENDEAKFSVMERAEEVFENVAEAFPSFFKRMLPSNVTQGFWLIFPKSFCNLHLPMHDTTVILVDECGKEYEAKYLVERHGLSGGWRGFSLDHRLLKGDILVFYLIKPCTLKVHIERVYGLDEVEAALCLMNIVDNAEGIVSGKNDRSQKKKRAKKCVRPLLVDNPQNIQKNGTPLLYYKHELVADRSETNSDGFGSDVLEGSEISNHQANESSCNQNPTLHNHLLQGINCRSTAGKVS